MLILRAWLVSTSGTRTPRISISPSTTGFLSTTDRRDIPMTPVPDRDHGTILSFPEPGMVGLIADFLQLTDRAEAQATQPPLADADAAPHQG
ncbi:MAG: hypothetical protein JWQ42_4502 [Edaphobacter sp.]|nr:hypothetical protein [Edaphobacter sp.]